MNVRESGLIVQVDFYVMAGKYIEEVQVSIGCPPSPESLGHSVGCGSRINSSFTNSPT